MPNIFPPKVTIDDSFVELGKKISLASMFSVADLDPGTTITRYRFRDNSNEATSGFFTLAGVRQAANTWVEIEASQLTSILYNSGLIISSETISIEAFDGLFWSATSAGNVFSVVPNIRRPVVNAQATSILSSEGLLVSDFVQSSDPDGYPITKYLFVDRSFNPFGGFFSLNGVAKPSGVWFEVNASDLPFLRYIGGQLAGSENIGIQTFDGSLWSSVVNTTWTTTPNTFAPTVTAFDLTIPLDRVISADQLFQFLDLDGNTLKKVQFFDTGVLATGGFFTVDGVVQAPNVWFEVDREQFGTIEYHSASVFDFERFRVRAFDGKFWSANASAKIVTVAPPEFIIPRVVILDAFQERSVESVISLKGGPPITKYQVIDLTNDTTSAKLLLNGSELNENIVHELTPAEFLNLDFKGGQDDRGREFDNILIRGFNGAFWGAWSNINVHTDTKSTVALDSGSEWSQNQLTYSFLAAIPNYYPDDSDEFVGGPIPVSGAQRGLIRAALEEFEKVLNIDFIEITGVGDITFGLTDQPEDIAAWAYLPEGGGQPGDVWFNKIHYGPGVSYNADDFFGVALHELGHALGLLHSFREGERDFIYLPPPTENSRFTVMSYTSAGAFNDSPMLYDVAELQRDYGPNNAYHTGNDNISLTTNYAKFQLIWDAGGIDTLDLDNQTTSITADLREGRYSSLGGLNQNVGIAYGTVIENLRSGDGADTLFGNLVNNTIVANAGADRLAGLGGNDLLRGGAGSDRYDYTLGDGFDTINEETLGGKDVLTIKGFGTFNSFTQDLSFRIINGRDLDIQLTIDGGPSQGGIILKDMAWGGSRVETLRIQGASGFSIGPSIDLRSIFVYSTTALQNFRTTEFTSEFGTLATPV